MRLRPVRFKWFYKDFHRREFTLLDVGCGDHSPTLTKKYFPKCTYYGIDREIHQNSAADLEAMDQFFEVDLARGSLSQVPDGFFDVVIFSHVIEHLPNGEDVLRALTHKLKKGGRIYVEFPSEKSLTLPSAVGTLHFCDDPTHVRVYTISEVANTLIANGVRVDRAGVRRDSIRLLLAPIALLHSLLYRVVRGRWHSRGMWDITGFAHYVYGTKQ